MKFFVSTGEASGDLHLSYLVKSVKKRYKDVEFYGVAGDKSKEVGVEIIQNIDELAIMGFTEILSKYRFLKKKSEEYLDFIKKNDIKNILLIDYGGFNLKFLELLKTEIKNVKIFYYIPPKIWIWGEKRIHKLKLADYIMVIFPWEVDFYKKHNVDTVYFGNPFSDIYKKNESTDSNILLLPGSRKQEIISIIPVFSKIIERLQDKNFILKLNSDNDLVYTEELLKFKNLKIEIDRKLTEITKDCNISIATSGTVTLELALLGLASIVIYKTSFINYFIAKYFLKVNYISLPNLILNDEIFPELVQDRCNPDEIIKTIKKIEKNRNLISNKIEEMRNKISGKSVIDSYSDFLIGECK